jgi:hypothetical protein
LVGKEHHKPVEYSGTKHPLSVAGGALATFQYDKVAFAERLGVRGYHRH